MKVCRDTVTKLMDILFAVAAVLYGLGTLMAVVNAVCRKFLDVGIAWGDELTTYLIVCAFFLTLPYLELHNGALCIGLLDNLVKNEVAARVLYVIRGLLVVVLSVIVVRYGLVAIDSAIASDLRTFTLRWPKAIFYTFAVAGFALNIVAWATIILLNKGGKMNEPS